MDKKGEELLEILLEISPDCHLIPAHIWTPWFSIFGSNSGFDHIDESLNHKQILL